MEWVAKSIADSRQRISLKRQLLLGAWELLMWTFLAAVAMSVAGGLAMGLGGMIVAVPATVFMVLMFPFASGAVRAVRRRRAAAVLGYLEQAVSLNQPLATTLTAAARSERGVLATRLTNLSYAIQSPLPLAPAIAHIVPEVPSRALGLIQYGERAGRLQETLHQLVKGQLADARTSRPDRSFARWYLPTLIFMSGGAISLCSIFVFPKYLDILHDFQIRPPSYILFLTDWGDGLAYFALGLALVVVIMCGLHLREVFQLRRRQSITTLLVDEILWFLPFSHSMQVDRALSDVCRALSDAVSLGRALSDALLEAADDLLMNHHMEVRVRTFAAGINAGLSPEDAARKARMPAFFVGMLATAKAPDAQGEVFNFLASYYGSRHRRRRAILEGATIPVMSIVMGAVVASVGVMLFTPIIQIIDKLCSLYGK